MTSVPFVSVIIPTFNYEQFILNAINSVFSQNYEQSKIEIIVIDDGSKDNTKEILKNLILENKIKYIYQHNKGKANATSQAIQLSKGEIIFNLDADDYFYPDKIIEYVNIFNKHKNIIHVASLARCIDETDRELGVEEFQAKNFLDKPIKGNILMEYFLKNNLLWGGGSTYSARADYLKKLPIPDEVDMYIDEYLILGLLSRGDSYCFSNPYSVWRIHGNNYSTTDSNNADFLNKQNRLLKSSLGTLNALKENSGLSKRNFEIYALKHKTRELYCKELVGTKRSADILLFLEYVTLKHWYDFQALKSYRIFARLLPTNWLVILKKYFQS